ncbi:MAG TPA: hypothetical protein VMW28_06200 [Pelolinea sp.]|nr:hypothetical protein [Pelolinea sp.]
MIKICSKLTNKKWFFPAIYLLFLLISFIPPITEKGFALQDTQDVIINLLMVAITPYENWGIIFHILTLLILLLLITRPGIAGRLIAGYMGANLILISLAQSFDQTEKYGLVIHTGGLIAFFALGVIWLWVAIRGKIEVSPKKITWHQYLLLPLALLAFWSPYQVIGTVVSPNFDPLLLLTSPDYGLTFCFTTPLFLYLLILIYRNVDKFAFRVTAFNGLLYALFNFSHWFNPDTRWMGVLHLPLLIISLYALIQSKT